MRNYRKSLPPLDGLLFFQAAVRTRSLTAAAEKMFVTQAAVSKRIHRLEDWLGTKLFLREGRNLKLTDVGREFASDVEVALDFLDQSVNKVKAPQEPAVQIASSTTISTYWLFDRLRAFSCTDAACNVSLTSTDRITDLTSGSQDLAIVYSEGNIPTMYCKKILDCELVPAAALEVANRAERTGMFSKKGPSINMPPLLEYAKLNPDWINWRVWLRQVVNSEIRHWPTIHCDNFIKSIAMARNGQGVALLPLPMMQQELIDGALVKIGRKSLTTRKSYHLCYSKNRCLSNNARVLFDFLTGPKCSSLNNSIQEIADTTGPSLEESGCGQQKKGCRADHSQSDTEWPALNETPSVASEK